MANIEYKLEKLSARNYTTWKTVIKSQLMAKDLWQYVVESKNNSDDERINNEMAKHLMYVSMDAQQISATGVCESAYDLWRKIKENHEGAESNLRSISLAEFLGLKFHKNETLVSYAGRYELALGKLQSTGHHVDEKTKLWVFSNTLPNHMKPTVHMFSMANPHGKVSELISQLKIQFHMDHERSDGASAFHTNEDRNKRPQQQRQWGNNRNTNPNPSQNRNSNNNNYNSSSNRTSEEKLCSYCKAPGHLWKECRKLKADQSRRKKFGQQKDAKTNQQRPQGKPSAFTAGTHEFSDGKYTWIVDSGASSHLTRYKEFLIEFKELESPLQITLGNGDKVSAYGTGTMPFTSYKYTGELQNVLWVPDICENLFSVVRAMQHGCNVEFNTTKSQVLFRRDNQIVLQGKKKLDSTYFLLSLKPTVQSSSDEHALVGASLETWHRRLGHCSIDTVKTMMKNRAVEGMIVSDTAKQQCHACILGKLCRAHHPSRSTIKASESTAILHIDTVGPLKTPSLGGSRYFALATEEFSGYKFIEFVASKNYISDRVKRMINKAELESKRPVKAIVTDNGTEYMNKDLSKWLRQRGIVHSVAVTYTPQQNGRAERANRTILDGVRTLLSDSSLPEQLWAEAARTVVYVTNRTIGSHNPNKTRYELFTGMKPKLDNLRVFGQKVIVRDPDQTRDGKLAARGHEVTFVGYTDRHNTYRLFETDPHESVFEACDVKFLEKSESGGEDGSEELIAIIEDSYKPSAAISESSAGDPNTSTDYLTTNETEQTDSDETIVDQTTVDEETIQQEVVERPATRAYIQARRLLRSNTNQEGNNDSLTAGMQEVALFTLNDEPRTIKDAKEREDWSRWQQAMNEELAALEKNKTWILVDRPSNVKPIKNKWVYKIKLQPDGEVERYKARLVAKGFTQIENVDYKETYAPVASMNTVRMFLAIANQHDMHIVQFDIKTAFLYGDLEETLFMEQPEGYVTNPNKVCKLVKSLYGLKQAPRQWNKKFDSFLKLFHLRQASIDKCLYFNDDRSLLLAIYVDDGLAAGIDRKQLDSLISHLKANFELKVMNCESYLGFKITRNQSEKTLSITQGIYVDKMLSRFGMSDSNPVDTPEQVGAKLTESPALPTDNQFKELVGSLLYLATCSRPDISHAVSVASRTAKPTQAHWLALKRVLRYLKGTRDLGISYRQEFPPTLVGYSDADYANDEETRKSTTGYCVLFCGAPIAWRCQRQPIITLSTTEAEYVAGCQLVKELLPIREQLVELEIVNEEQPTTVLIDNQSTVRIAANECGQSRTKHIDIRHKWLTEQVQKKKIAVKHVKGDDQAADLLTKPLYRAKFTANRSKLLTNLIAMLALVSICYTPIEGRKLRITDPLTTVPSEYVYIKGDTRYRLTNTFYNPCESLFNYSTTITATQVLIKHCFEYYEQKLLKQLSNCNRLPTVGSDLTVIPLTYDCAGNYNSDSNDQDTTDSAKAGKCTVTKRQQSESPDLSSELDQIAESWNRHKKRVNALPVLRREKRVIPVIALFISLLTLGTSFKSMKIGNANSNDIEAIANVTNEHSQILKEATDFFEQVRDSISTIQNWSQDVEERLGSDPIDSKFNRDPIYRGKKANLVKNYMHWFETQEKLLLDINYAAAQRKIPPSLETMVNLTSNFKLATNWSRLFECNYQLVNKSLVLDLDFSLPTIDDNIEIMKVVPMNFYYNLNDTDGEKSCWATYIGPTHVMHNTTSGCLTKLNFNQVYQQAVRAQTCNESLDDLHLNNDVWQQDPCTAKPPFLKERIQIHAIDGIHKIYCYPFDIEFDDEKQQCPNGTFLLDGHINYRIDSINHTGALIGSSVSRQIRSTRLNKQPNKRINALMRQKRSAIPATQATILHPPPTTTSKPSEITTITTKGPEIVLTLRNITGKMNETLSTIKDHLNSLPKRLNITKEHLDQIISEPLDAFRDMIEYIGDHLKSLIPALGLFGGVMVVIMIMPAIEIVIVGARIIRIPINLWLGSVKRVSSKIASSSTTGEMIASKFFNRRRRRWDDGDKMV